MAFIGKKPTAAPLTSSDVADGIITNAKLAQDIISADTALGATPADTDEFLVSDAGVLKRMDYSYIKGGITEADQWRLNTSFTNSANPIASNLERNDDNFTVIGTGMTESSGVFTFPSTGIWKIEFSPQMLLNGDDRAYTFYINHTLNNGTDWTEIAYANLFVQQTSSNSTYNNGYTCAMLDVTDTSNHKVAFRINVGNSSTTTQGDSGNNLTFMSFIRLGDT